jgi:Biofilm formation protein (YliH/bssR)
MVTIGCIVHQALTTRYLSLTAETKLRQLLHRPYSSAELQAYWQLRQAISQGAVQQESRQLRDRQFELTRHIHHASQK